MRILFMGTPELAAVTLAAIDAREGTEIVGVVTRPDKPKGRGMKLLASPVKEYAESHGIPVFQPKTLRGGAFDEDLRTLDPELIVVAAYGNILPHEVLVYPKYGCVNAHGSLLPKYRGASPIQRAILDGERETGITAMYMDDGIDTGDIIEKYPCPIEDEDDCGTLTMRLAKLAGEAMCDVIGRIEAGTVTRTPQPEEGASYAAKIEKEDTVLDFSDKAQNLVNRIRALSPSPCAMTTLPDGSVLKITAAKAVAAPVGEEAPGTVLATDGKGSGGITVRCGEGALLVTGLVPAGKKNMSAGDFVRGRRVSPGECWGS
ncbi:MAG: methionyl-tRNA formyltransferase [Clostridia bacterium]|nr:methionyl-tRNA formyltransferase [Clostridia bacterium]